MTRSPRSRVTTRSTPLRSAIGLSVAGLVLAGCGTEVTATPVATGSATSASDPDQPVSSDPGGETGTNTPTIGSDPTIALPPDGGLPQDAPFVQRAEQVATEWLTRGLVTTWRQGLVPAEPLTREPDFSQQPELETAWSNGQVRVEGRLPALGRAGGGVTVGDARIPVAILSAEQALRTATPPASTDCAATSADPGRCAWVEVTRAVLTTTTLQTNRGEATVPAWVFTIAGLDDTLVQVAVSPTSFDAAPAVGDPIPGGTGNEVRGLVAAQGILGVDDTMLSYTVGVGACDRKVLPRVHETKDLVVVGATVETDLNAVCTEQLLIQPVQVQLASPVGHRAIVDALTGVPVLATTTPE